MPLTAELHKANLPAAGSGSVTCMHVYAGHGAWLTLWQTSIDMQYMPLPSMTNAQFQGLDFPDIVQLTFLGNEDQYIAGCSSMGLLAIWHKR